MMVWLEGKQVTRISETEIPLLRKRYSSPVCEEIDVSRPEHLNKQPLVTPLL